MLPDAERLQELALLVDRTAARAMAPATLKAYQIGWADFELWCDQIGLRSLPATAGTIAAYLSELAEPPDDRKPLAVATIEKRRAAIAWHHRDAGVEVDPVKDPLVATVMRGIRNKLGTAPKHRKKGLSVGDIRAIVAGVDGDRLIDVRDRAVLLLGFATAVRRSELAELEVDDLEDHPEGILVHIRKSKTDQAAAGHRIEVAYGSHVQTCPVRAVRTWIEEGNIDGPLFRPVDRHSNIGPLALTGQSIAIIVKRHARRIGVDADNFAGHSLRRGFSTEASRGGAPDRTILRTTRHTTTAGLDPYIEDADIFTDPPNRYLDL